jgi:cytochrome b561
MVELHKATGLALLVLVILRICLRLSLPHPPLPRDLPAIQRWPPAPRTCCCTP